MVAIVTGGTRNIGKVISKTLAAAGAHVVIGGRSVERGERTAAEIVAGGGSCRFVVADLSLEAHAERLVRSAVEEFGSLDVVVSNAAATDVAMRDAPVADLSTEDFDHFLAAGLRGAFWMFKFGVTAMNGSGSFVSIGSLASLTSRPAEPAYAASKGGLTSLARQVAVDYGPLGIRSNTLVLGFIQTNASKPLLADPRYGDKLRAVVPGPIPEAKDVAAAVLFLASDAGHGFNGATLVLDGGLSAMSSVPAFE
jgi:NAD(P)-dependent dehydrogenase (short-subunit alcohol dehydrogenase family)